MGKVHSMGRRPVVNGDEQDAYTHWRHLLCYLARPGAVKKVKRSTHKRERQEAKATIRAERVALPAPPARPLPSNISMVIKDSGARVNE